MTPNPLVTSLNTNTTLIAERIRRDEGDTRMIAGGVPVIKNKEDNL